MDEDERAIRDLIHAWMAASRAGDTAAVLDMMTDDVVFMTPGRDPFGKAEFEASSKGMCDYRIEGHADVCELEVLGDWAWIRNRLELEITPPDGEASQRSGYTLTILRKGGDGRWRLYRDANLVT
jgi:uncharacterized protein (TIGR02246 family)